MSLAGSASACAAGTASKASTTNGAKRRSGTRSGYERAPPPRVTTYGCFLMYSGFVLPLFEVTRISAAYLSPSWTAYEPTRVLLPRRLKQVMALPIVELWLTPQKTFDPLTKAESPTPILMTL